MVNRIGTDDMKTISREEYVASIGKTLRDYESCDIEFEGTEESTRADALHNLAGRAPVGTEAVVGVREFMANSYDIRVYVIAGTALVPKRKG